MFAQLICSIAGVDSGLSSQNRKLNIGILRPTPIRPLRATPTLVFAHLPPHHHIHGRPWTGADNEDLLLALF
jgi:hypothetical protein